MVLTLKYYIYHSRCDRDLNQTVFAASVLRNHLVALVNRYYKIYHQSIVGNTYRLNKHVLKLRKSNKLFSLLNAQAAQEIAERVVLAYKKFLKGEAGHPRFIKSRKGYSFTLKQSGYKIIDGKKIKIGKKVYRYKKSQDLEGKIKRVTIKRDSANDFYICLTVDSPIQLPNAVDGNNRALGIDFGLKHFCTLSNGEIIDHIEPLKNTQQELAKKQRQLARKQKGSRRYKATARQIARLYKRITNQRRYFFYNLAHYLCSKFDLISIENLNIKAMSRLWGRKIADLSWSMFITILEWVAKKTGKTIVKIDRFYPSSKTCSNCKYIHKELTLKDRVWSCPECGVYHNRDFNASQNILRVGVSTHAEETVRPSLLGTSCLTAKS